MFARTAHAARLAATESAKYDGASRVARGRPVPRKRPLRPARVPATASSPAPVPGHARDPGIGF